MSRREYKFELIQDDEEARFEFNKLYLTLKLHERIFLEDDGTSIEILRVIDGWVHTRFIVNQDKSISTQHVHVKDTFSPEDNLLKGIDYLFNKDHISKWKDYSNQEKFKAIYEAILDMRGARPELTNLILRNTRKPKKT